MVARLLNSQILKQSRQVVRSYATETKQAAQHFPEECK